MNFIFANVKLMKEKHQIYGCSTLFRLSVHQKALIVNIALRQ